MTCAETLIALGIAALACWFGFVGLLWLAAQGLVPLLFREVSRPRRNMAPSPK